MLFLQILQPIKRGTFFCLMVLWTQLAEANTAQFINFPQAVQMALTANPRINASTAKVAAAEANITQARANALPELDLASNAARSNNPLNVFSYKLSQGQVSFADFGASQYTGPSALNVQPTALNEPGYYGNFNNGVVLNVPIFSGGEDLAKLKRAQSLLKAAQAGDQQAKLELTFDVLQAYEGVRATSELVNIAKQALLAADNYMKLTQSLHQQSLVLQSDVLLSQTNYRSAKTALEDAIAQNNNQMDTFHILIGRPDSDLVPGQAVFLPLPRQSIDTLRASAYLSNTQLSALKAQVDASQANINSAKAGYWPEFDMQLRHDWNAPNLALSGPSNTVMLEMNWSLFHFGAQTGADKQATAEYLESVAQWQTAKDNVRISIIQTVRAIQTTLSQINASDLNAQQTMQMVKILRKKYGQAAIPLGELLDAESRLETTKVQQVMNRYNLLLSQARLLILINQLDLKSMKGES